MLQLKRSKIVILILVLLPLFYTLFQLLRYKLGGAYYVIDPDVVYIANAISYIKLKQIHYTDHPGTPTILLIAFSYWPFRIYAKLIEHVSFIDWSFFNLSFLYIYTRIFQSLIFVTGLYIYLSAVSTLLEKNIYMILAWGGLFLFSFLPNLPTKIFAETESFLIISVWLYIFAVNYKNKNPLYLQLLAILSGIALAIKFNNFVLLIATLMLVLVHNKLNLKQKIMNFILLTTVIAFTFLISTFPVRSSYERIFGWIIKISSQTGPRAAHGVGEAGIFIYDTYIKSVKNVIHAERNIFIYISIVLLLSLFLYVNKKIKYMSRESLLGISSVASIIILLKYPTVYYLLPAYLVFVFYSVLILGKINSKTVYVIAAVLIFYSLQNLEYYTKNLNSGIRSSININEYYYKHSSKNVSLWSYSHTKEFAMFWSRSWAGGLFDKQLSKYRPDLLELKSDNETVQLGYSDNKEVFDSCWNDLYINTNIRDNFLQKYSERNLKFEDIPGTNTSVIFSNHCN